jgi:magnesium-transporting ATPase (P-type)
MPKKDKPTRKEGTFAFDLWQNLEIGDIVIMKKGYEFPADVLIIDSEILQHSDKKTNNFSGEKTT